MYPYLVIGTLLLGAAALTVLFVSLWYAEEGCEDESGFHPLARAHETAPVANLAGQWSDYDQLLLGKSGEGI
jgi:hypothetical protein